jgi:hypothetical protein
MKAKVVKSWRKFRIPVYGSTVYAYRDQARFKGACDALNVEWAPEPVDGMTLQADGSNGSTVFLVGWFNNDNSTLIHEMGHLAIFILVRAGIDPKDSNGETLCYLLGTLCQLFEGKKA